MTIKVFGHKSPDTDSTGSPIVWAWYLNDVLGKPAEPRLLDVRPKAVAELARITMLRLPTITRLKMSRPN